MRDRVHSQSISESSDKGHGVLHRLEYCSGKKHVDINVRMRSAFILYEIMESFKVGRYSMSMRRLGQCGGRVGMSRRVQMRSR